MYIDINNNSSKHNDMLVIIIIMIIMIMLIIMIIMIMIIMIMKSLSEADRTEAGEEVSATQTRSRGGASFTR